MIVLSTIASRSSLPLAMLMYEVLTEELGQQAGLDCPNDAQVLLEETDEIVRGMLKPVVGDSADNPNVILIWLPGADEPWCQELYALLKRHCPDAYLAWIGNEITSDGLEYYRSLNQPEQNSYLLNLQYPQDFPIMPFRQAKSPMEAAMNFIDNNPLENLLIWLNSIIG